MPAPQEGFKKGMGTDPPMAVAPLLATGEENLAEQAQQGNGKNE